MQTNLHPNYQNTRLGSEAEEIIRACVHCGFCTATCPTYLQLGDERDSPRGRIYLIKQLLETDQASEITQTHLDRCLTCRACETTCPSDVQYGALVDIGRELVSRKVSRPAGQQVVRWLLRTLVSRRWVLAPAIRLGWLIRPVLPTFLKRKVPPAQKAGAWPKQRSKRKVLMLEGCAQSALTPTTNAAAARVLARLGIEVVRTPKAGCCGALSHHLTAEQEALANMKKNIDAWWPFLESGVEAVIVTASGCGTQVKDYGRLLSHDPDYAEKAKRIALLAKDLSEVVAAENLQEFTAGRHEAHAKVRVAVHTPCTLQHGQQLPNVLEQLLGSLGFQLCQVRDKHLCCGSAGTYSLLQPQMSQQLLAEKIAALLAENPDCVATANVGCQLHIATAAGVPVKHWIELVDEMNPS